MKKKKEKSVLAWHFLGDDHCLRGGSKFKGVIKPGMTVKLYKAKRYPLKCCSHGLHASIQAVHALNYRPGWGGNILCRVRLSGDMDHETDKLCASKREVLFMMDAEDAVDKFFTYDNPDHSDERREKRFQRLLAKVRKERKKTIRTVYA